MKTRFNMNKIEGPDANIETSLFEYHLAWIESDCGREFRFWYAIGFDNNGEGTAFDWADVSVDIDVTEEYSWADFKALCEIAGLSYQEWVEMPLTDQIRDLISYYSEENVFGTSYSNGFKYNANINRFQYSEAK